MHIIHIIMLRSSNILLPGLKYTPSARYVVLYFDVHNGNLHSYELILISVGFFMFQPKKANICKRIVYSVFSGNLGIYAYYLQVIIQRNTFGMIPRLNKQTG